MVTSLPEESERIRTEYWYKDARIVIPAKAFATDYLLMCHIVVIFTKHFTFVCLCIYFWGLAAKVRICLPFVFVYFSKLALKC